MTRISNRKESTEDYILWNSEPSSEEREEYVVPSDWDTDVNITPKEFEKLFGESHDESNFEEF